jgi:hypothetical protein
MRLIVQPQILASLLLTTALAVSARADEISNQGREIFDHNHNAVVTVEAVQKVLSGARSSSPREAKEDATGVVVDPSGLTVVALSSLDPAELYRKLSAESKTEIEVSDVKILTEGGDETPAEIVLRDKDLDLAFIRPKTKPASPMAAIDLSKSATAQLLDQFITLNRLKRVAGRAFSASVERISAVVQKPRTFYVPENSASETTLGSPAFALNGNVIGLFVMRAVNSQGAGNIRDCLTGVIIPAADILKSVPQALAAKGEEKKEMPKAEASTNAPPAK